MKMDIVEDLRDTADRITRYTNSPHDGLMFAAADEIDRLRAEVAKMQSEHEDIEKLRTIATLIKELAKGSDWNNGAHAKFYRHQLLAALAKDSSHE